jgi:hypothetical protein
MKVHVNEDSETILTCCTNTTSIICWASTNKYKHPSFSLGIKNNTNHVCGVGPQVPPFKHGLLQIATKQYFIFFNFYSM